jgi:ribonuclease E
MANKMLIDAAHPEETRVVVLRGNRVEEFDFESAHRRQLRGNIYLAKVTRVEPSLQAAFVEYGGNRHGFLAFSEIHPDYYQIPVADRQALIEEEERAHRAAEAEADRRAGGRARWQQSNAGRRDQTLRSAPAGDPEPGSEDALLLDGQLQEAAAEQAVFGEDAADGAPYEEPAAGDEASSGQLSHDDVAAAPTQDEPALAHDADNPDSTAPPVPDAPPFGAPDGEPLAADAIDQEAGAAGGPLATEDNGAQPDVGYHEGAEDGTAAPSEGDNGNVQSADEDDVVESVGGADALEEASERPARPRRQYKIQEVIKRRQVLLVQVVKEERGTKGAALTTYLSLAGRYCVLMPNTARGGGISRKITDARDRSRLKEVAQDLEVPEGMGVILRTAGAARTKLEIKRDFEYLLRVWESVRDLTLRSSAPTLVYEEGSLVKRAIRDLYTKDIDEIIVSGTQAYEEAREFMGMLMPSHVGSVKHYRDNQPLFSRYGIESQLDAMFSPVVQLRSGGYIVLNQTEALVSIDVNSGRATREHHIEDTALKTNLEAADEIARQLRLRDLAGLIVIDFIDMDEKRNDRAVERRLKDALKNDRARIQVGRISHFGLMEMSRQRIRASVLESSTDKCALCGGTGHVRSVSSVALQVLRLVEETLLKNATHNLLVRTRTDVALYLLNNKRGHLRDLEQRFQIAVTVNADAVMTGQQPFLIEKGEQVFTVEQARAIAQQPVTPRAGDVAEEAEELHADAVAAEHVPDDDERELEDASELEAAPEESRGEASEGGRGRRRRRRRGRRGGEGRSGGEGRPESSEQPAAAEFAGGPAGEGVEAFEDDAGEGADADAPRPVEAEDGNGDGRRRRRRGRRGGRRNRRGEGSHEGHDETFAAETASEARAEPGFPDQPAHPFEPELATAVADFGGPPLASQAPVNETPAPEAAASEASPRRRSTVREPVAFPGNGGGDSAPAPTRAAEADVAPAPDEPSTPIEADKPRRTGWWAKRLLGDRG